MFSIKSEQQSSQKSRNTRYFADFIYSVYSDFFLPQNTEL